MSFGSLTIIGLFGAVWAVVQFGLKNHFEQLKNRRASGILFLTKINQCAAQLKYGISSANECVCFESYSSFAINLSFKQAETLRECWDDYLRCRSESDPDTEELVSCLQCLELNVQENTEPLSMWGEIKHSFHKAQLSSSGLFGETSCYECGYEYRQNAERAMSQNKK